MPLTDLRYRLSEEGRVVLGQLTADETLEFEVLSQKERDGLMDLQSELRLLDLYVKYHGPVAQKRHEPRRADCTSPTASGRYAQAIARRKVLRSIAMMAIISLMCAGLAAIVFLAD